MPGPACEGANIKQGDGGLVRTEAGRAYVSDMCLRRAKREKMWGPARGVALWCLRTVAMGTGWVAGPDLRAPTPHPALKALMEGVKGPTCSPA